MLLVFFFSILPLINILLFLSYSKIFNLIKFKKKFINKTTEKINSLNKIKNNIKQIKLLNLKVFEQQTHLVKYILNITFFNSNTLLQLIDSSGKLVFCCSAGTLNFKGKKKKIRKLVLRDIFKKVVSKVPHLRRKPIALHLKNVSTNSFWIVKMFKKFFFINILQIQNSYPFNGCRKKKVKRKKIRTKKKFFKFNKKQNFFNKKIDIKDLFPMTFD